MFQEKHDPQEMFGPYKLEEHSGANPPWSPTFPVEWGCQLRTLDVMTRVDKRKLEKMFAMGTPSTPFELVNDRVVFQFMSSPDHSASFHKTEAFDLMLTVPVRYEGLFTTTHLYIYHSDPMGICMGREVMGYTKRDCTYEMLERTDGSVAGWVERRGFPIADFKFTPDPTAPVVLLVDGDEQPKGEVHVRRVPHPAQVGCVYADVCYRKTQIVNSAPTPGRIEMNLYGSKYDPIAELEPEILSAQWMTAGAYGGGFPVEDRMLVKRLL